MRRSALQEAIHKFDQAEKRQKEAPAAMEERFKVQQEEANIKLGELEERLTAAFNKLDTLDVSVETMRISTEKAIPDAATSTATPMKLLTEQMAAIQQ